MLELKPEVLSLFFEAMENLSHLGVNNSIISSSGNWRF